jgi:hypothetical protein
VSEVTTLATDREVEILELLTEGDDLLVAAFVERDRKAFDRLRVITNMLCNDHGYKGAKLARRWDRDRRTISLWKKQGAKLRDS